MEASSVVGRPRYTIAELLETRNISAVARKLGVDPRTPIRWRDGEMMIAGDKLQALAALCGVDASQIDLSPAQRAS